MHARFSASNPMHPTNLIRKESGYLVVARMVVEESIIKIQICIFRLNDQKEKCTWTGAEILFGDDRISEPPGLVIPDLAGDLSPFCIGGVDCVVLLEHKSSAE